MECRVCHAEAESDPCEEHREPVPFLVAGKPLEIDASGVMIPVMVSDVTTGEKVTARIELSGIGIPIRPDQLPVSSEVWS